MMLPVYHGTGPAGGLRFPAEDIDRTVEKSSGRGEDLFPDRPPAVSHGRPRQARGCILWQRGRFVPRMADHSFPRKTKTDPRKNLLAEGKICSQNGRLQFPAEGQDKAAEDIDRTAEDPDRAACGPQHFTVCGEPLPEAGTFLIHRESPAGVSFH